MIRIGPRCVVVGTGRMAGGFVAPVLADAGWSMLLLGRDAEVVYTLADHGELIVRTGGAGGDERRVPYVSAARLTDRRVPREILGADLLATAVGPSSLTEVGRWLAPFLRLRMEAGRPVNVLTFENHRRAPELLTAGLLDVEPGLATEVGHRLGIGGAAVWRAIASRRVDDDGVRYEVDAADECYVDEVPLIPGVAPCDGSLPALRLTAGFDDRMVEKLWVFNAGHAAAAYFGWSAGHRTVAEAMADADIHRAVVAVVEEARFAFQARRHLRHEDHSLPTRPTATIVERYADPAIADPVTRVAREPRRKLAPDDRLVEPAVTCLAAGVRPLALSGAAGAAFAYADPDDPQACDIHAELEHLGPEEVVASVSGLHPRDELSDLICERIGRFGLDRSMLVAGVVRPAGLAART